MIGGLLSQGSIVVFAVLGVLTAFLWTEWREAVELIGQKDAAISSLSAANDRLAMEAESQRRMAEKIAREKREALQHAAALKIQMAEAIKDDACAATPAPTAVLDQLRNGSR